MKKSFWLILVLCLVVGIGCKGKPKEKSPPTEENPTPNSALQTPTPTPPPAPTQNTTQQPSPQQQQPQSVDLVSFYKKFAGNLYGQVAATSEEDFVFSPLAAFQELGILLTGTDGKTKENIQRLIGTSQLMASEMGILGKRYMENQNSTWSFSSVWIQKDYPVIKLFTERINLAFSADIYSADLLGAQEESLRLINAWSSDMTRDNVPAVLSDYPEQTRLLLTNILMHRVNWQQPFHMNKTSDQEFTPHEGERVVKSMMHKAGTFPYYQSNHLRMLVLPYHEPQFRLVILIPSKDRFKEFEKFIAEQPLDELFSQLKPTPIMIKIPLLEIQGALDLSQIFAKTFINPNLKGISQSDLEPLAVGPIIQKTFFKMTESGTSNISPPEESTVDHPEKVTSCVADQPFIFVVWHAPSMSPIVMGRVVK